MYQLCCFFSVFFPINLTKPAAQVIIYTKYRLGEWYSTIYLKMHVLRPHFVQCNNVSKFKVYFFQTFK